VSFTITAGPRQRSHSRVRVLWDSCPYFTVSDSRQRRKYSFPQLLYCCMLPNGNISRAVPLQQLSLLASQFWFSAGMPQYLEKCSIHFRNLIYLQPPPPPRPQKKLCAVRIIFRGSINLESAVFLFHKIHIY
jgi:hypothetical protein